MLAKDLELWRKKLDMILRQAAENEQQLEMMLAKQSKAIESVMGKTKKAEPKEIYFQLDKQPQLPDVCPHADMDFSWPDDEVMNKMLKQLQQEHDEQSGEEQVLKIQKLNLIWNGSFLSGVQVELSNGVSSPVFKAAKGNNSIQEALNLSSSTDSEIQQVQLNCDPVFVSGLKFTDKSSNEAKYIASDYKARR